MAADRVFRCNVIKTSRPVFHNNNVNGGNVDEENDKIRDNDDDNCNIIDNDYGFAADMVFRWDVITVSILYIKTCRLFFRKIIITTLIMMILMFIVMIITMIIMSSQSASPSTRWILFGCMIMI